MLSINPEAPTIHYNIGVIYYNQKKYDLARKSFLRELDKYPDNKDARYYLEILEQGKIQGTQ